MAYDSLHSPNGKTAEKESLFVKAYLESRNESSLNALPSFCVPPSLENHPLGMVPVETALELAKIMVYNITVVPQMAEMASILERCKGLPVSHGLVHFDKDIEGSDTQILPDKGDISMARIRGRVSLGQETIMVSAASVQSLIDKVTAMVTENLKKESAPRIKAIPTFEAYAADWLENYCKLKVEKTTYIGYQSYLRAQLYDAFGSLRLDEITAAKIQQFINDHKDHSVKSLKNYMKLLSLILQSAMEDGYITVDATKSKKIVYPNKKAGERIPLTENQLKDILSNISNLDPQDQLLLALLIFTGARRGEILGLKALDIDWEKDLIHIRRQLRFPGTNQGELVDHLKMGKKGRDLPILKQLCPFLPKDQEDRLLFGDGVHPWSQQQFRNAWIRIEKKINLYGATPHVLRHTFLTFANNHGADPKTLQTLAGHSSAQFTFAQYVHPQTEQLLRVGHHISSEFSQL